MPISQCYYNISEENKDINFTHSIVKSFQTKWNFGLYQKMLLKKMYSMCVNWIQIRKLSINVLINDNFLSSLKKKLFSVSCIFHFFLESL